MSESVTVCIDTMLKSMSYTPLKPSMFRVGDHLRSTNPEAYDPKIIAIGPFHHGKSHLQNMEQHKFRYLGLLLQRREESSVERYVATIKQLEDRARKCYAEDIHLDEDKFVKMLILDGCFIVEFLRKCLLSGHEDQDDPIFQQGHIHSQLFHDLMLFENQIPFFIVDCLFNMIKIDDRDNINTLIRPLLQKSIFPVRMDLPEVPSNAHHLLGIVHDIHCSSGEEPKEARSSSKKSEGEEPKEAGSSSKKSEGNPNYMVNINSAKELAEAGISFKKLKDTSLFDIKFKNKVMKIPEWKIFDSTESLFRNLIAYEYYLTGSPQKPVTDYVFFMDCLVNSPEDAKLLRLSGIISNFLGSDRMVYRVINQLEKNIIMSQKFSYSDIFDTVNDHCGHKWNRWMAKLRREYFNSPWALISVLAAIILLLLAIIQSTFAILSFRNDLKGN